MFELRETSVFANWLGSLRDAPAKARIAARVQRLAFGHFGDVQPVGNGVRELRLHFGPGYRIYFVQRGRALLLLLCGGDKSSQRRDILRAKPLAADWPD